MLENIGKIAGRIITAVFGFVFSWGGKILVPVGTGMVQAMPWYVKVIIVLIIISILLPLLKLIIQVIKLIIQGIGFVFRKIFKK